MTLISIEPVNLTLFVHFADLVRPPFSSIRLTGHLALTVYGHSETKYEGEVSATYWDY
jgi:hypothetical protein